MGCVWLDSVQEANDIPTAKIGTNLTLPPWGSWKQRDAPFSVNSHIRRLIFVPILKLVSRASLHSTWRQDRLRLGGETLFERS
jgi:hypothetical protein